MAIVKKYKAEVIDIINSAENIFTIEFKSLNGNFKFAPGQFLHLALDEYEPSIGWPESRCFSIQSNSNENLLKITYSVKGRFTKRMANELKSRKIVSLKLPYGDLFLQEHNKQNTVFIAGGTGITPFLSLFTNKSFDEYVHPLIYLGFRSKSYNIYKDELSLVKHGYVKIFYEDVDGPININQIISENSKFSDYFISGPPQMIKNFKDNLKEKGIHDKQIKTDDWD